MKKELINILICPGCRKHSLKLSSVNNSSGEDILFGELFCLECGNRVSVENGIPDFIHEETSTIKKEICGNDQLYDKERKYCNEEWLLSLPSGFMPKGERIECNVNHALAKLKLSENDKVLEVGAGVTWLSCRIARDCKSKVVATDILRKEYIGLESADIYRRKTGISYETVLCTMERLPFIDESFDAVIFYASLHHAENISKAFQESSRVLKPKGRLVLLHEGVSGLLRNNRLVGYDYEKLNPHGWNEHTYWAKTYFGLARKYKLRSSAFWPSFLLNLDQLEESNLDNMRFKRLGQVFRFMLKNRALKKLIENDFMLWFALMVFGIPLNMVGVKENE